MKINVKSLIAKIAVFVVVLGGAGFGAFLLTPSRKVTVDVGGGKTNPQPIGEETYFSRFVKTLTDAADENNEAEISGLVAHISELEITWPSKDGLLDNDIVVSGDINFKMKNLKNLDFTLDLLANYNGKEIDLGVGYVNKDFYLAVKDLRLKTTYENTQTVFEKLNRLFFDPTNPNGLGIEFDFSGLVNDLIAEVDLGSMMSGDSGLTINEVESGNDVTITLGVPLGETNLSVAIVLDKNELTLKSVDLGTINVGTATIAGKLNFETISNLQVLPLDHENYPIQRGEFIELINYVDWADRILDLLQTKSIGLDIDVNLDDLAANKNLIKANADINLDATKLLDLVDININGGTSEITESDDVAEGGLISDILNVLYLDANLDVELANEPNANLDFAYFKDCGYLSFNENDDETAVLRTKFDIDTLNGIFEKIPSLIEAIGNDDQKANEDASKLFDFITSSELVTAIKNGVYDGVLDLIKELKNSANKIELNLDLSSLGLGNSAEVDLVLDSSSEVIANASKVTNIYLKKIELGSLMLDCTISTKKFSMNRFNKIESMSSKYDNLDFAAGILDQVTSILNNKKAGFSVEGSMLDSNALGFKFKGWGQFDYQNRFGFGSISFDEYKNSSTEMSAKPHVVDIDIRNPGDEPEFQNMLFQYRTKLKGKFTVKTLNDIVGLVKELIRTEDERFTKFFDMILEYLLVGVVADVVNGDYVNLASRSFIKSIGQNSDGTNLSVVIGENSLPLIESDLKLVVNFKKDSNNQKCLDSISIVDLGVLEQSVNVTIKLEEFNDAKASPINPSDTFMNFSDLSVLLKFGLDTTELNYYHLTAAVNVQILKIVNIDLNLDFHIYVNGVTTKVYGKIPDIPLLLYPFVSQDAASTTDVSTEFVFEPSTKASGNDIGGYFHILRTEIHKGLFSRTTEKNYYRTDSQNFLNEILTYLLVDVIDLNPSIVDTVNESSSDSGEAGDSNYEDLFFEEGFSYTHGIDNKDNWIIKLNLGALLGKPAFGNLSLSLDGVTKGDNGYFTQAKITIPILKIINIKGTVNLVNPDPAQENWPTEIENKYLSITGIFNNMSENEQKAFIASYQNRATVSYLVK